MMHAAGIFHEHARPDRDSYVSINTKNIEDGNEENFRKGTTAEQNTRGVPYDYLSVMHYGRKVSTHTCTRDSHRVCVFIIPS